MDTLTPERLQTDLEELLARLAQLEDAELCMAALYGSAARPDFDAERSDVNLLLAFSRMPDLEPLSDILQRARTRFRCAPLVLTASELMRSVDVFPVKLLEMRRGYRLLAGEDLFTGLTVSFEPLRHACEHDLRNAQFKLRRTWLLTRPDPRPLQEAIRRFLPQVVGALRCLLDHAGASSLDTFAGLCAASEAHLGLDLRPMERALALRHHPEADWLEVSLAYEALSCVLSSLLVRVARLEGL